MVAEGQMFVGGLWEEREWELRLAVRTTDFSSTEKPCPHCHSFEEVDNPVWDNSATYKTYHWICPRVIVARNEGGYNSTGVCADCVLEALNQTP